ncbi:conserved hypothetical protein [Candidatus Desulfarcum epimagneticum]|uniref:Polymerase nucleotidyl transferase domain-containing protein n=1 Tax=uncultured Desulfobacteraceae bacterium TaxID=218296 RepID=A0A484HGS5_9BACT|nr:conserved hypothetical protein [uncultured Desulfobacteraceae bacterium]
MPEAPDPRDIITTLKAVLQKNVGGNIKDVILFGSQAAGTANENSDYDVLIVLNCRYDWKFRDKVVDLLYDLELEYEILINAFMISDHELRRSPRGAQPVFVNALREGLYA